MEDENNDQASVNPPFLTDGDTRAAFLQLSQYITTQEQAATTQAQDMTTQANWEVVPWAHQQVSTMASLLRDFTRMNPSRFYGSMVEEYPQDSIHEINKILYGMGLTTSTKPGFAINQLKDVSQ